MHDWTKEDVSSIMTSVREWFPTIILVCAVYVGVTALFALLLVVGVCSRLRCLMVPFLILSMLDIVLSGTGGIVVVVALFQLSTIHGLVSLAVYLVSAVVSLYCWATVLSAYKYLANSSPRGSSYSYSPVTPAKDIPQYYPRYCPIMNYPDSSTINLEKKSLLICISVLLNTSPWMTTQIAPQEDKHLKVKIKLTSHWIIVTYLPTGKSRLLVHY